MNNLFEIIQYLVDRGLETILKNTDQEKAEIDYVAIFCRDEDEFQTLCAQVESKGKEIDLKMAKTGRTFQLHEPISTKAGLLHFVKIRKPDLTRTQRGGPDFKVQDYTEFKEKYLMKSGNFTLMLRPGHEMIEIKGIDVLVYIPSETLGERLK